MVAYFSEIYHGLISLLEGIILRSHVFAENILARGDGVPLFRTVNIEQFFDEEQWRIGQPG